MIRFVRQNWRNVALLVGAAVLCTVLASGWASEHKKRLELRELATQRLDEKQTSVDNAHELSVGLMAANAIIMGSYQYEARKAGKFENQRNVANGRLGPMQRTINELERELEACAGSGDEAH